MGRFAEIFADGQRDDTPGLCAALNGETVVFDGRIYGPQEHILILDRVLKMTGNMVGNSLLTPTPKVTFERCRIVHKAPFVSPDHPQPNQDHGGAL